MIDRDDLKAAVNAGVLNSQQAMRLEAFLANRAKGDRTLVTEGAGESENLRFLSNFNDIFITIGLLILFGGFGALFGVMVGSTVGQTGSPLFTGGLLALGIGGLAWAMMEYFCARRRMLLPSMFLAIVVSVAGGLLAGTIVGSVVGIDDPGQTPFAMMDQSMSLAISFFVGSAGAALLIFRRFGLPFSLFIVAVSAAAIVYMWLFRGAEVQALFGGFAMFLTGLGTLAVALIFDMRDPERVTRSSDHAFWLHLAAAPQVIYGVSGLITGTIGSEARQTEAVTLLIVLLLSPFCRWQSIAGHSLQPV